MRDQLHADDGYGNLVPLHPVQLVDGRVVSSWSEDWRHECEARHILNLPTLGARQGYLYGQPVFKHGSTVNEGGILQKRGEDAMRRLQATMTALWERRRDEAKAQVLGRRLNPANDDRGMTDERKTA